MTTGENQSEAKFEIEISHGLSGAFEMGPYPDWEGEDVVTYRHGNSPIFYPIKMPGLGKVGNAVMLKCRFPNSSEFQDWSNRVEQGTVEPFPIKVRLADQDGPLAFWKFEAGVPVKVSPPVVLPGTHMASIEEIEIQFDAVAVSSQP